ncbi:DUF4129 domain-containing protein [Myroides sp. LoEW2-1]|uniref:DUF4129 domain-containing protein n=1 Tax=Myroides sp. LoEW2-1 TaxID=2683192 RepID=UPI00132C10CF|nr:DUF4129 domain-containing protein [Myroides sp. LoEW2-1]MVX35152.1 DUF4129 domain-containing protein [Myroides sp. LoEW2-1]
MNSKLINIYIFFSCLILTIPYGYSQQVETYLDSIAEKPYGVIGQKESKPWTYDLPLTVDTDSALTLRKFRSDYKKRYLEDKDFQYDESLVVRDNFLQKILKAINEFFDNIFGNRTITHNDVSNFVTGMRILAILVFFLIVYYVIRAFIQKDIYWGFKRKGKDLQFKLQNAENDIENADFPTLIKEMIQRKEYRIGIRFYYLWLLQHLQEQNIIQWHVDKTNTDYLLEIKNIETKEQFQYLSYLYNHIWYGEHLITEEEFNKAKAAFDLTLKPGKNE